MADNLTNEQIATQLAELKAQNDKLAQDNKTLAEENQKILKALNQGTVVEVTSTTKKPAQLPTQRVKIGQAQYAFQVPVFYLNGFYYIAEEIVADQGSESAKKILGDLVKMEGQEILRIVK